MGTRAPLFYRFSESACTLQGHTVQLSLTTPERRQYRPVACRYPGLEVQHLAVQFRWNRGSSFTLCMQGDFLLFGGISSLDNILSGVNKVSLLKLIVICCVWGLGLVNLIFVFLFCVSKMTKIAFASSDAPDATIFQKYPIFWWTNYIIVSIMIFALALLGMHRYGLLEWLDKIKLNYTELKCMAVFIAILILIFVVGRSLSKQCKNRE